MVLNRYNILVFIQILFISLVGLLIAFALTREFMKMTTAGLIILWVGQIFYLNFFVSRIHRDVNKFMLALKNQDTSGHFNPRKQGNYFNKLYRSFNEISKNFRLVRIETELENQFFQETIKQSASGILAVANGGNIRLINRAAMELLGVDHLSNFQELQKLHPGFSELETNTQLEPTQLKLFLQGKLVQVAVKSVELILQKERVKIYSLQDISREMARNEVEAWQKLIRVLNHEIINSVSPIHILSTSVFELFHTEGKAKSPREMDEELIDRAILGLKTIMKRSGGLTDFLNTYKSFTSSGDPVFSKVQVSALLTDLISFMSEELDRAKVKVQVDIQGEDLELLVDEKLIEQTLINLLKNSLQALDGVDKPRIELRAGRLDGGIIIEVRDTGRGIPEEMLDHVFTPFFTSKKEGSGIGLSLARQVMHMHNGSIGIQSVEGQSTTITLFF